MHRDVCSAASAFKYGLWYAALLVSAQLAWSADLHEPTPAAVAMRQLYESKRGAMQQSPLGRELLLDSKQTPDGLEGDVVAVVDRPLQAVTKAFDSPQRWCDALLLHINNRDCVPMGQGQRSSLVLSVVRKYDLPVTDAFRLPFALQISGAAADHLDAVLTADSGPLGTSHYRIQLQAIALDDRRSFLHFSYAYDEGFFARTAMQAYLATFGSSKVGFTALGRRPDGQVDYIRGTRGLVERNAMRYFLALDAHLLAVGSTAGPTAARRMAQRAWFAETEKYPRQLHEIDEATYLRLKSQDQDSASVPGPR